jgi:xanthine dehydrogenase accessory factor
VRPNAASPDAQPPAGVDTTDVLALPQAGSQRGVLEASARALRDGDAPTLVLVLDTEGSTYVQAGALALFGATRGQAGWLSGGCIEPEIELAAQRAADRGGVDWMDIDTRQDEDLFSGSAVGCRGRLRLALLPLARLPGWPALVAAWARGDGALVITLDLDGGVLAAVGDSTRHWLLAAGAAPWQAMQPDARRWTLSIPTPTAVLVFGAGPESPALLPLLRTLGFMTTLVEQRPRWAGLATLADAAIVGTPTAALSESVARRHGIALVMHHHFDLDREALAALADHPIGFIGLLGPARRREDLFKVLPADARAALLPRLHSPIGLPLGGEGPEAIALSIAAQLQSLLRDPRRE